MELNMSDLRELIGGSQERSRVNRELPVPAVACGYKIVVCQRGFVYAGDVVLQEQYIIITNAVNLRVWGTTKGLGQLALTGATPDTKADDCGTVRVHELAVVSVIDAKERIGATA